MAESRLHSVADFEIPDLRDLVHTVWRRRMLAAIIMAAVIALGATYVVLKHPVYAATATVLVSDRPLTTTTFSDVNAGPAFDDTTIQTEVNMLTSPTLAMATIRALKLTDTAEYARYGDDLQSAVDVFIRHLTVTPVGTSRVITVTYKSKDPALAAKIVNALVGLYLDEQTGLKRQRIERMTGVFTDKVKDLELDVGKKAQAVEDFRADNGITSGSGTANGKDATNVIDQQISDISSQLAPIAVHDADVQSRLGAIAAIKQGANANAVDDIVKSPLIQNLKTQQATAAQALASLRAQYGPSHPKVIAARQELNQANAAIANETRNIKGSLTNDAQATEAQQNMLQSKLETLRQQQVGLRGKLITLNQLMAEEDASQKVLDNYLETSKDIQSQLNLARPDAVVVSRAATPVSPAGPPKIILLFGVAVVAGCLALGVIFGLEALRGGLRNFDDVRKLGRQPLGILPLEPSPERILLGKENSGYRESMKRIYMASLMKSPARTILITSALPNEGRTSFVISLAHYLVAIGHSVAVIDADFHRPALSEMTRQPRGPGLTDVLAGKASLDLATDRGEDGVSIVRAGSLGTHSPDLFNAARLHEFLKDLHQTYTYILIDSSPILAHTEGSAIAAQADGVIVVAEWLKTSQRNVGNMFGALDRMSAPVLGVVITKVDIDKYKTFNAGSDFLLPKIANA